MVERHDGQDGIARFGEFDFLEDGVAEDEGLSLSIAHGRVAFGIRRGCAFGTGRADDGGARRVFSFGEAAEEVEGIGLWALGGGD